MPSATYAKVRCEQLFGKIIYWDSHEMIKDQGEVITNDRFVSIWLRRQRHEGFCVVWVFWQNDTMCKAKLPGSTREWLHEHWPKHLNYPSGV